MTRFPISLLVIPFLFSPLSKWAAPNVFEGGADQPMIVARGHAVCLDVGDRPVESLFACAEPNQRFGFSSSTGKLFKFLPYDVMTPVFTDTRVRQRELQLTARLHAQDLLEIIKVQSVKGGQVFDILYFCEVCNIKAFTPGLCPCCRAELEFRETPP